MENKKLESMSLDFESSMRYMVQKSNQRAWIVAFFSVIVAVLSVIAVCLLTPLKTVEPYVVRVDNTTGMVDIITTINNKSLSMPEAVDKHFINTYVKAREGYYYDVLDKDYVLTQLLSNADVAAEYRSIYEGENARNTHRFQVQDCNYNPQCDEIKAIVDLSDDGKFMVKNFTRTATVNGT